MHRSLAKLLFSISLVLLICCVGVLVIARGQRHDLILPNATNVRQESCKTLHLCITYAVPAGTTQAKLRQYVVQQGWQQLRGDNSPEPPWVFVRESWYGLREVATVRLDPRAQDRLEVSIDIYYEVVSKSANVVGCVRTRSRWTDIDEPGRVQLLEASELGGHQRNH